MNNKEASICQSEFNCNQILCTRQEVINLALGFTEEMKCVHCLAQSMEENKDSLELLLRMKDYIAQRECFAKVWQKYTCQIDCPSPQTCYPAQCFSQD